MNYLCFFNLQLIILRELKDFCNEMHSINNDINISDQFWEKLDAIIKILSYPAEKLKKLQRRDITLSDFYGLWVELKLQVANMEPHPLAVSLTAALKRKDEILLNNNAIISCVYLDPRFQCMLSNQQKELAKDHLVKLYSQILSLESSDVNDVSVCSVSSDEFENTHNFRFESEDNVLEQYLESRFDRSSTIHAVKQVNIKMCLEKFDGVQRISSDSNVLEFWKNNKTVCPELKPLVELLFSASPTEVEVERNFSHLKCILNRLRNSLSDQSVKDIMLIKLNKDLFCS